MRNAKRYGPRWRQRIRALRESAGNRCQHCGIEHGAIRVSPWTGHVWPVWLQGAHPDHDPENPDARIVIVCPSCHWQHYRKPGQRLPWIALEKQRHQYLIKLAWLL